MREEILTDLNNAIKQYNELQKYSNILPSNLMDGAKSAIEKSIPHSANKILSLLNSVSGENLFDNQNTVLNLITLLNNKAVEIDHAFKLVNNNENIKGYTGDKLYNAKEILGYLTFWFKSNCDTITITLTAGKVTTDHYRNMNKRNH
ncbi:hypothetical protein V8G69_01585 [Gaetbulibacter sp. M235]|uniref:hypothetical protein n=1 Tax=Gaetbulibacter sp. M235 TaxID=3126510 RepID=UPI00374F86B5